jgi:TatD DNase family protein
MEQSSAVGILHWYTGSATIAERALAAGLYFSVNPSMLRTKGGRSLLSQVPPERVLTETDGPYCRCGSRECRPADVLAVVEALGDLWGLSAAEAAEVIIENMARLYSGVTSALP